MTEAKESLEIQGPNIQVDASSVEEVVNYDGVEPVSINRELLVRLLKTNGLMEGLKDEESLE